jgi:CheY-like chemotaxis protein
MPAGGIVRIQTANVPARDVGSSVAAALDFGDYVRLTVTDNGQGMRPEVVDRALDPFFTTKGVGKGSGLGLSMVHGFVTQSGGTVRIESEPGRGTTVTMYLPRDTEQQTEALVEGPAAGIPRGAGERILVVADPAVSRLLMELLERLGYVPVGAADGATALTLVRGGVGADALLTEIVLSGGMQGADLASAVRERIPKIPVLYLSGHATDVALEAARAAPGAHILRGPFDYSTLAKTLRRVLDT